MLIKDKKNNWEPKLNSVSILTGDLADKRSEVLEPLPTDEAGEPLISGQVTGTAWDAGTSRKNMLRDQWTRDLEKAME